MSKLLFFLQICSTFVIGWFSMDFIRYVIFQGDLFYLVSLVPIIGAGLFLYLSLEYEKNINGR
jgi:hypothetical protein